MLSQASTQASLAIDFLIVGGGIGGLTAAIALRRVGHRVVLLEKEPRISPVSGGFRMTPNFTKIFYNWGLEKELRAITVKSEGIIMMLQEQGDMLGIHTWSEEMLRDARGEYLNVYHSDLIKLLYDTATSAGAVVRYNAHVESVTAHKGFVTLTTGETVYADVIVGADGAEGLTRRYVLDEEEEEMRTNFLMYNTTIPKDLMMRDPELAWFFQQSFTSIYAWFGNGRVVIAFPLKDSLGLHVYGPPNGSPSPWNVEVSAQEMQEALGPCDPRLQKMSHMATRVTCTPYKDFAELEDWVDDSGHLVVIGEAAHRLLPLGQQCTPMAVEDAAVLAKLFSHLRTKEQIQSFLYAFQELRSPRCTAVSAIEWGNVSFMALPPCEFQQQRDEGMMALHAQGKSPMNEAEEMWEEMKMLFGYDAEDEADNWWVQWGLLRERSQGVVGPALDFGLSMQVAHSVNF